MFKLISIIFLLTFVFLPFFNRASAHEVADETVIHIDEKGFTPTEVNIDQGEKVVFENTGQEDHWPASNIHPTHSVYSEFDPKKGIKPGETWEFVFTKAGSWKFHDHLFPEFTGTVIVKGSEQKELSWFERFINFFKQLLPWTKEEQQYSYPYNPTIQQNDRTISSDNAALFSYVKKFGTKQAVEQLASVDRVLGRDCHQAAHSLGKFAYEIYGEKTFASCSADCHSGCYHGATEAYFQEHGTAELQANLKIICGGGLNAFFEHQCLHGVGHGLMAWSDYEIHEALKECDLLEKGEESCYTGVFMENIVGGLALESKENTTDASTKHYTKYLSDDPQYPCSVVDEKYKYSCYFYQTSRMVEIFNYDFTKVSEACLAAPQAYHSLCFESMGRDVSSSSARNPEQAILLCQAVPFGEMRTHCLTGAVQDMFWETTGQTTALHFCKILTDSEEKDACYQMIFARATEVLATQQEKNHFCEQAEDTHQKLCQERIASVQ